MKKILLLLTALTMVTLTGCGEKEKADAKGSSNEKVVVRFGWWGSGSRHEATLKAIEEFEAKYPNIDVKPEYAGWTGYNEKLTTQMVGNSAPDLMQVNWNVLFDLGSDKWMDLQNTSVDLANYPQAALDKVTIDGKVVAIPVSMSGKVFFYQKNTFDKAGIDVPQSFDDLFKAAKVFKEKLGNEYYPLLLEDYTGFLMVLYYCEQVTGKPFIGKDNKVAYTVDELKAGFDFYLKLVKEGVVPTIAETQAGGVVPFDQNPKWINGLYAGNYEWDTSGGKVQGSVAEGAEIVVGGTPKDYGKPALMNKIGMTFAINNKTKHAKEAELLLNYLIADQEGVMAMNTKRGIPLNTKAAEILEKENLLTGIQFEGHKVVGKDAGLGIHPNFESGELKEYYRNTMQELDVVIDSREAAEKIINMVDSFLAEKTK